MSKFKVGDYVWFVWDDFLKGAIPINAEIVSVKKGSYEMLHDNAYFTIPKDMVFPTRQQALDYFNQAKEGGF